VPLGKKIEELFLIINRSSFLHAARGATPSALLKICELCSKTAIAKKPGTRAGEGKR